MDRSRKKNRNILGFEDENNGGNRFDRNGADSNKVNSEQLFIQQNDQTIEGMNQKANTLKRIVLDIESQVQESNNLLDRLETDLSGARALLSNTMSKLSDLSRSATNTHMLYLIIFVVFIFMLIWFLTTWTSKSNSV
ncbi:hypothetical protein CYY_010530 [Polysphondylium violaceum]|uniref:t-SNARE coiled-coil homology domain-containing protein n=1 Tax=Polysphondylium violaceum TaxID=133409 RepID=A0A8J4PJ42_9MYCE|nr:hypothetical protein CYY_010530 [Polysphondylium violaceum]